MIRAAMGPDQQRELAETVAEIVADAPFFIPKMPRSGKPFSVRMTNAGPLGWVSDKAGYRYQPRHPEIGRPWPAIPAILCDLWKELAPGAGSPEACLVNRYEHGSKLGSHVDRDEAKQALSAPVISVSLGDDAVFHVGGLRRSDAKVRFTLRSGDVVVLGGAARLAYHGIDRVLSGTSALLGDGGRINLTLRRVTPV